MKDVVSLDAPGELERVWSIMHILTSDDAWRGGWGKLVDSYLKTTASMISRVYFATMRVHASFIQPSPIL